MEREYMMIATQAPPNIVKIIVLTSIGYSASKPTKRRLRSTKKLLDGTIVIRL
jgi:uncharacterized phosphosugar-binding protein